MKNYRLICGRDDILADQSGGELQQLYVNELEQGLTAGLISQITSSFIL